MTIVSRRDAFLFSLGMTSSVLLSSTKRTEAATNKKENEGTIVEKLGAAGNFNSLLADMAKTGVWTKLEKYQSFTLLAPTDYAYAYAREGYHLTAAGLQKVESLPTKGEELLNLMYRHLIPNKIDPSSIKEGLEETTLDGMVLSYDIKGDLDILVEKNSNSVRKMSDMFMVNLGPARTAEGNPTHSAAAYDANLTAIIEATNGIIYVIDAVLLHPIKSG